MWPGLLGVSHPVFSSSKLGSWTRSTRWDLLASVGWLHQVAPGFITRRGPSSRCWTTLFRIDSRISRSGSESRFTPKKSKVQGLEAKKSQSPLGGDWILRVFCLGSTCRYLSFSFWTHAFLLYFRLGIFNGPPRSNSLWETHSTNRPQFED